MSRPRMSTSDELRYCRNALADALAEHDALAVTVQRVEALCEQWEGAAAADIGLDFQGPVRIGPIARALRAALAPSDPATDTGGEGQ